jgi:peptidyl-tRNA hydrolase
MPAGKLAAQASHASANSLIQYLVRYPERLPEFANLKNSGSRVAMKGKNLAALERAYHEAQEAGLPCYLMSDSGHVMEDTVFDGSPVVTALGIGPCTQEEARPITKRFQCL